MLMKNGKIILFIQYMSQNAFPSLKCHFQHVVDLPIKQKKGNVVVEY